MMKIETLLLASMWLCEKKIPVSDEATIITTFKLSKQYGYSYKKRFFMFSKIILYCNRELPLIRSLGKKEVEVSFIRLA